MSGGCEPSYRASPRERDLSNIAFRTACGRGQLDAGSRGGQQLGRNTTTRASARTRCGILQADQPAAQVPGRMIYSLPHFGAATAQVML